MMAWRTVSRRYRGGQRVTLTAHQLLAVPALTITLVSVLPIPNIRPYCTLAVAVSLLALLQFL
jgi:hypothetical protein